MGKERGRRWSWKQGKKLGNGRQEEDAGVSREKGGGWQRRHGKQADVCLEGAREWRRAAERDVDRERKMLVWKF